MYRFLYALLGLLIPFLGLAEPHPAVVETFYSTMKKMSNADDDRQALAYRSTLMDCFKGRDKSGIYVPNDFSLWSEENNKHLTANFYSIRFFELAYKQKKLRMTTYDIKKSSPISEVQLENFKNKSSGLVQSVVTKTLTDGNTIKTFLDTLIIENGKIVVFTNAMYNGGENVDIDALRALAARYYSMQQYRKAYETYEKIIQYDPKNGNAYYRLSILTYYGAGCEANTKKAIEYAEKARELYYTDAKRAIYYYKTKQRI